MTYRLTTDCAKNYCNRTLIVKVIVENVVTCFLLGHSVVRGTFYATVLHIVWHRCLSVRNVLLLNGAS